jgi:hypothetical protein
MFFLNHQDEVKKVRKEHPNSNPKIFLDNLLKHASDIIFLFIILML